MQAVGADGVELWWAAEGRGDPVMLVPGRGDSTDLYPARFVGPIVEAGFRVLRYDPRDTGLSGDGGEEYGLAELALDAATVMDAAGAASAHLVGFSMGGLIVSELAISRPDRVRSLTFLSASSPDPDAGIGPDFFEMVGDDPVATFLGAMHEPTGADRAWVVDEITASERRAPRRPESGLRHQESVYRSTFPTMDGLGAVERPTLVVHGAADRKLPLAHGRAFATGIIGADLVVVEDMGHLPRPDQWDAIAHRVVEHLTSGPRRSSP